MHPQSEQRGRVVPPVYLLAALIVMVFLHILLPVRPIIPLPYRHLGVIPLAGSILLVLWSALLFRDAGTTIKPFQKSSALVVRGPYRLSRNPMYVGLCGVLVGAATLLGSISPFTVVPAFVYLIDRRVIRAEEEMLEQTFDAGYADYKARVRRWL